MAVKGDLVINMMSKRRCLLGLVLLVLSSMVHGFQLFEFATAEPVVNINVWVEDGDGDGWIRVDGTDLIGVTWTLDLLNEISYFELYADGKLTNTYNVIGHGNIQFLPRYVQDYFGASNEIHVWYGNKTKGYTKIPFTLPKRASDFPIYIPLEALAVISGVITDETTGDPIVGALITAESVEDKTGADGSYTLNVPAGTYTVTVGVGDAYQTYTTSMTVIGGGYYPKNISLTPTPAELPLVPIAVAVGGIAAVAAFFLLRRKPTEQAPKPSEFRVTAEPTELLADGRSASTITIELLDDEGAPIPASEDVDVELTSTRGFITSPVTIPKGHTSVKALLRSSTEVGGVRVAAASKGVPRAITSLTFVEKKRYCMHCGTRMPLGVNRCPKCGREPPSGVDVKACPNCSEVIPTVAQFCSNCGANQPSS